MYTIYPELETPASNHDYVETGTRKSWCRKCNHNAFWDTQLLKWQPEDNRAYCSGDITGNRWAGYFSAMFAKINEDSHNYFDGKQD